MTAVVCSLASCATVEPGQRRPPDACAELGIYAAEDAPNIPRRVIARITVRCDELHDCPKVLPKPVFEIVESGVAVQWVPAEEIQL